MNNMASAPASRQGRDSARKLREKLKGLGNKMKKKALGVSLAVLLSVALPVDAQLKSKGGYTSNAYSELDAGETYFQRVSDWFATVGKSKEETALIRSRRRTVRKANNAQRTVARKKKEIRKKKKKMTREVKERENNRNN